MVLKGGEEGKDGGRGEEEHGEVLIWKRAMAARPRDPQLWCGYSTLLVRLGRTAEAVEGFQRALKIDPNHMATICNFAIFMEQQGNTEVVCELYERALAADTSPVTAMSNYGHFLCRRGDFDRAVCVTPTTQEISCECMFFEPGPHERRVGMKGAGDCR